jgi:hypothetical protein
MITLLSFSKMEQKKTKGFIIAARQFLGHETATLLMIGKVI